MVSEVTYNSGPSLSHHNSKAGQVEDVGAIMPDDRFSFAFIDRGAKVNTKYYRKNILKKKNT